MRSPTLATIFLATLLLGHAAQAMEIQKYDKMSDDDQDEYVADLVVGAEKVLTAAGHREQAERVNNLFTEKNPGDKLPRGMVEFEILLDKARVADDLRVHKDPNTRRLEVEDAMALTLKKHEIDVPDAFFAVASNFRPKHQPKN